MNGHDIVVVGASAGGIEALRDVSSRLPSDLAGSVFAVLHLPRGARSNLPEILSRSGPLPADHAKDGATIERGRIYVAPPDRHLLLEEGRMRLSHGPDHNRHRPAVDPLFRSAALAYGPRVVGVVLSGTLDDGTAGLAAIKRRGGIALVQDPATAAYPGMPESALANVDVDRSVPLPELGAAIMAAVNQGVPTQAPVGDLTLERELEAVEGSQAGREMGGTPSVYGCPECHGVLWEFQEGGIPYFRCRVGHSFSSGGLETQQDETIETSLWAGIRALEESASLRRRLAARQMSEGRRSPKAKQYAERAQESERHAAALREMLLSGVPAEPEADPS